MPRTPQETFHELTERVAKLVAGDVDQPRELAGLYAENTHVSFPLAPDVEPLLTREALQEHFTAVASHVAGNITILRAEQVHVHATTESDLIIAEFLYTAETSGGTITAPNVFVMRVVDGEIVESRDYSASLS